MAASLGTPPAADEVEVSVFGPGVGECIVVHTGGGEWIVVDSCLDGPIRAAEPVALRYLSQINVNVETAVRLVVITHWHDDHIRGIGEVFRRARAADVVVSVALNTEQFVTLTRMAKARGASDGRSAVDEFAAIHGELAQRVPSGARWRVGSPTYALARLPLSRPGASGLVTALSPSQVAVQRAQVAVCERMQGLIDTGRRLVSQGPNDTAIALWIEAGTRKILLGSDLENATDPRDGWTAVVADAAGLLSAADVFKVAHHGSSNAHHAAVWTAMLAPQPFAVLTPYRPSRLPGKLDLQRLKVATDDAYLTADVAATRPKKRSTVVEGQLNAVTLRRRAIRTGKPGHVRLRMDRNGGPATVDLFDGARRV